MEAALAARLVGRDDLPVAILQLQRAWEFILDTEAARGKDEDDE